jgi:CubicO group peptidase (beta-lactamase class C family)
MKKLLLAFLIPCSLWAQKPTKSLTLAQVKDSIQKIMETEHIVGAMVGITTRDSVLMSEGFGYADLDSKRKADQNTLFRMGSNTKMLVALGILKLQSEGKLNINNELRQVAPEIRFHNPWEATHPVRIVHLLEHTSGFDDMKLNRMYDLQSKESTDQEAMLYQLPSMVCRWRPGERHSYSNPNYGILGYLINKITKKPFAQYLTETILKPLGMNQSNFNLYSRLPNDTKEYIYRDGKIQLVPSVRLLNGAAGALWSSSDDMLKLLQMYLRDGQPIFDKALIDNMETPHSWLGVKERLKSGYALGNYYTHFYNKYGFRGHNGLTGTCYSTCIYNRELGIGYVIASNSNYHNTKIEELIAAFVEQNALPKALTSQKLDKKTIEPFLGFYQFDSPRNQIATLIDKATIGLKVFVKNDTLIMQDLQGTKTKLLQVAPRLFRREGMNIPTIAFTQNADGQNVLSMAGVYYEQSSYSWALFWRGALLLMVLFIVLSGLLAILSVVGVFLQKLKWSQLPARFVPIVALGLFGFSFSKLLDKQQFSYSLYMLNDLNGTTLLVFVGTTFLGVAGLLSLFFIPRAARLRSRWGAWFWTIAYISTTVLALVLAFNGLIGVRFWTM